MLVHELVWIALGVLINLTIALFVTNPFQWDISAVFLFGIMFIVTPLLLYIPVSTSVIRSDFTYFRRRSLGGKIITIIGTLNFLVILFLLSWFIHLFTGDQ